VARCSMRRRRLHETSSGAADGAARARVRQAARALLRPGLRAARTINVERLALALLLFALIPVAIHVDALATIAALNVLLWAMVAYETVFVYDERRYRLRHGLEIDIPGSGS